MNQIVEMPVEEDSSSPGHRDLVSTVEDLIMQALASSNLVGDSDPGLAEQHDSVSLSVSEEGSVTEPQTSIELREMLSAVLGNLMLILLCQSFSPTSTLLSWAWSR